MLLNEKAEALKLKTGARKVNGGPNTPGRRSIDRLSGVGVKQPACTSRNLEGYVNHR
jgi:hypothetical protein